MKSSSKILSELKKGDYLILFSVMLVSLVLFLSSFFSSEKLRAEIYLDGECISTVNLYELGEKSEIRAGNCTVMLEKDGVSFISSACPDKLCVNRGKLKKAGDTMACVPEKVTVVLKGVRDSIDAVVF